jgi:aldose 1-epimerase
VSSYNDAQSQEGGQVSEQRSIRLEAPGGATAEIMTTGAAVRDLVVPMPDGPRRVVLGYADPAHYYENPRSMGVIVGRYANRIRDARFTLDGRTYDLPTNERGRHHIHGGLPGFGRRDWVVLRDGVAHPGSAGRSDPQS